MVQRNAGFQRHTFSLLSLNHMGLSGLTVRKGLPLLLGRLGVRFPGVPKPYYDMADEGAVYLRRGRKKTAGFWCRRESEPDISGGAENRLNGQQSVRGLSGVGIAESHRQSLFRRPVGGDLGTW